MKFVASVFSNKFPGLLSAILFLVPLFIVAGHFDAAAKAGIGGFAQTSNADSHPYLIRPFPEAMGFAFIGDGTTGGTGGEEVTVINGEELLFYATRNEPYIINVIDTIEIVRGIGNYPESNGEYHLGSNTTLRGIGPNATILYGGFRIQEVENVIIQNLSFDGTYKGYHSSLENISCSEVPEGQHRYKNGPCLGIGDKGPTDNALEITESSERVWITQNSFRRYSDEVMSIKREASYVTLSWNKYDDPVSGKDGMMILIGHSDGHVADIGRLKTTLHHNAIGSSTRQPRVRFGQVHIFNNYYYNPHGIFSYGAAAQRDSEVVIEGNYFEDVGNRPWRTDLNQYPGYVDQRNNIFVNTNIPTTRGSIGNEIFEPEDMYDYTLDDPDSIPDMVMAGAGAGNWDYQHVGHLPVPGVVYRVHPGFGETVDSMQPVFKWDAAILATGHQVQISTDSGFLEDGLVVDTVVSGTEVQLDKDLESGNVFFWRVRGINDGGASAWTDPGVFNTPQMTGGEHFFMSHLPDEFKLQGNFPNPFNPTTTIRYALPEVSHVTLRIYDVTGRLISEIVSEVKQAGYHTASFDARNLASGVYLYRISAEVTGGNSANSFTQTRKMTLVK